MKFHGQTAHREANANLQATQDCQGSREAALTPHKGRDTTKVWKQGRPSCCNTDIYIPGTGQDLCYQGSRYKKPGRSCEGDGEGYEAEKTNLRTTAHAEVEGTQWVARYRLLFLRVSHQFPRDISTPSHSKKTPLVYNKNGTFEQAQDLAKDAVPAEPPPVVFGILARQEKKRKKSLPQLFPLEMGT